MIFQRRGHVSKCHCVFLIANYAVAFPKKYGHFFSSGIGLWVWMVVKFPVSCSLLFVSENRGELFTRFQEVNLCFAYLLCAYERNKPKLQLELYLYERQPKRYSELILSSMNPSLAALFKKRERKKMGWMDG